MLRILGVLVMAAFVTPLMAAENASVFGDFDPTHRTGFGFARYAYNGGDVKDFNSLAYNYEVAVQAQSHYSCDYRSAIEAFERFKADTPGERRVWQWWLKNQDAVFITCGDANQKKPLTAPLGGGKRAQQEFDYHKLAQAFHMREKSNPQLIEGFRKIAMTRNHPRQRDALRTYITLLAKQGDAKAWAALDQMRTDPATREVYPFVEDTRFIILDQSWNVTPEERVTQLRWLMGVVQNDDRLQPGLPADTQAKLAQERKADASAHLSRFFVESVDERKDSSGEPQRQIDWWMKGETKPVSPRLEALRRVIAEEGKSANVLAWMQVNQTYVPSLRVRAYPDEEYQRQAARLAAFAHARYRDGKGREWLPLAVKFTESSQPAYAQVISDGMKLLKDEQLWRFKPEDQVELWTMLIERRLEEGNEEAAYALLADAQMDKRDLNWLSKPEKARMEAVEWYVMKGNYQQARRVMALARPQMYDFSNDKKWNYTGVNAESVAKLVILAQTRDELLAALARVPDLGEYRVRQVISLLPRHMLLELVKQYEQEMTPTSRLYLARMIFTRAWLLNDKAMMVEAATRVNKYAPAGDSALLRAMEGDEVDILRYMLASPRMRPMATPVRLNDSEASPLAIDIYNHNDNNWWCGYKPAAAREGLAQAWSYVPKGGDIQRFAEARTKAMAVHPLMSLIDEAEQADIAQIAQAPEFLTEKVLALQQKSSWWGLKKSSDARLPEMLHLAVRTTRYGCNTDGSHQSYSFRAFRKLHRDYPDNIWTKATPYWFK